MLSYATMLLWYSCSVIHMILDVFSSTRRILRRKVGDTFDSHWGSVVCVGMVTNPFNVPTCLQIMMRFISNAGATTTTSRKGNDNCTRVQTKPALSYSLAREIHHCRGSNCGSTSCYSLSLKMSMDQWTHQVTILLLPLVIWVIADAG